MRRVKIFKGISTSDDNSNLLNGFIDEDNRVFYLLLEREERLVIKTLPIRFFRRLKTVGFPMGVEEITGLESQGVRERAYYMDDSAAVCCHRAGNESTSTDTAPYLVERIDVKNLRGNAWKGF